MGASCEGVEGDVSIGCQAMSKVARVPASLVRLRTRDGVFLTAQKRLAYLSWSPIK